ncbi:uncharacterized protein LOC119745147 [Patiria miniata]|uniref:LRRCT domain-containing protein n=1 Tax=Patiria miniata TaxID=46514 RepID=A0A914BMX6_PATMI|nr:uncharacterized protein LOC119745147 [Patiria miniata]
MIWRPRCKSDYIPTNMASYKYWTSSSLVILVIAVGASLPPLERDAIQSSSSFCWEVCTCDSIYQLVKCAYLDLPSFPFDTVRNNTRALSLPGNLISSLSGQTLQRFRQLRLLDLAENQISWIAEDAFEGQPKLMELILSDNHLSGVPVAALLPLKSLRVLNLARNNITYLGAESFVNLTRLQTLSLVSNGLHVIDPGAFLGLEALRVLQLDHNFLTEIPAGSLSTCTRLELLDLASNSIGTFFNSSESLGEFSVRSWFAPTEPTSLTTLNLSKNIIDFFSPSCFQGMTRLSALDLSRNYIQEIPESLFEDLGMLDTLNLNRNSPLYFLPAGLFHNTPNLKILRVKHCQLTDLPKELLYNTSHLQVLDLTANGLYDVNFLSSDIVPFLRELRLSQNSITQISDDHLFGLSMLEVLDLSGNQLTKLPLLHSLSSLQELNVAQNDLSWLGATAFRGTSIMKLDLSFNNLQSLKKLTIFSLPDYIMADIILNDNPWTCDCQLLWTLELSYKGYTLADLIECAWPLAYKDLPGGNLYVADYNYRKLAHRCTQYPKRKNIYMLIGVWFGVVAALILLFWAAAFVHARRRFRPRQPRERFLLFRGPTEKTTGSTVNTGHSKVRFKALDSETESLDDDETTVEISMNCCGKRSSYFTYFRSLFFLLVVAIPHIGKVVCFEEIFCPLSCVCDFDLLVANCSGMGLFDVDNVAVDSSYNWTESLDFSGNFLSAVDLDTLSGFPSLLDLSLAGNEIQDITNGSFGLLEKRLHRLVLGGNMLSKVPTAIRELRALRELDLSRNNLWYLAGDSFEGLDVLESLNLDHNSIHVFDGAAFRGLTSLNKLSLTENFLAEDPVDWFEDCPMRELYLSHNAVPLASEVRTWFGPNETTSLEHLVLINNNIDIVDGRFRGMVNLLKLDLGRNQIKSITKESMEGLPNLVELIINSNSLMFIDKTSFRNMFNLQFLSIDENKLVSLPGGLFGASKRLTRLNAARNNLEDISAITDEYLPELAELYLYSNAIQHIASQGFTSLPMLSQLVAGDNLLSHVPNVTNLPELQTLELSRNEIHSVSPTAFRGSHSLLQIYLEQNQLEWLQYETFAELFYLEKLSLSQNAWWCDCRVEWMQDLMFAENPPFWVNDIIDGVYCSKPPELSGAALAEVTSEELVLRCPNLLNRNVILVLLGSWFGVIFLFVARFWCRKFSKARKRKTIGRRNIKYQRRQERSRGTGIFGNHLRGHGPIGWSDSYALILQNTDYDEHNGGGGNNGNGKINRGERVEIARVTTV